MWLVLELLAGDVRCLGLFVIVRCNHNAQYCSENAAKIVTMCLKFTTVESEYRMIDCI